MKRTPTERRPERDDVEEISAATVPLRRATVRKIVGVAADSADARGAAAWLEAIARAGGAWVGRIGPESWSDGWEERPVGARPLGPKAVADLMSRMSAVGCDLILIEADDAMLAAGALSEVTLDAALDLGSPSAASETIEEQAARRRARGRLFRRLGADGIAAVAGSDPESALLGAVKLDSRTVDAESGSSANLTSWPLGPRRRRQADAAAALAEALELPIGTPGRRPVEPGRLEPVDVGQAFTVRVDRAGTADELVEALSEVRAEAGPGARVICLVTADARLDRAGRIALGRAAEEYADVIVLTHGRLSEPTVTVPDVLLDDVSAGCLRPGRVRVEPERRRAVASALEAAGPGDIVLIAGRGRDVAPLGRAAVAFDDRAVAAEWLHARVTALRPVKSA